MGRNLEKDAIEMAAKNQRILENGFRIFAERTIDQVKMSDVAEASGIGIASLYRYYSSKQALVMAVNNWAWGKYIQESTRRADETRKADSTAAEDFDSFLEAFLDMYAHHKDILRFNQFFNVYLQSENISETDKKPFTEIIDALERRFGELYRRGRRDGTLRTDMTEKEVFSAAVHLMMAAVTRYAVGLAYDGGTDAEEELRMLKEMLRRRFTREEQAEDAEYVPAVCGLPLC